MNMKMEVQTQLLGEMITGRCEAQPGIYFFRYLCSGNRIIRFTTETLEKVLPSQRKRSGAWKTGVFLQYEIINEGTSLQLQLSLSTVGLGQKNQKRMDALKKSFGTENTPDESGILVLRQWNYEVGTEPEQARLALDEIFDIEVPFTDSELRQWMYRDTLRIRSFPKQVEPDKLEEGKEVPVRADRFERNLQARRKCIAHYGTTCQICQFDFGYVYGNDFAGKIEVHHIVPLSEIREDHVVDPIRDLIPVCSNCHTALHSKKDGCYTPDELRRKINPHYAFMIDFIKLPTPPGMNGPDSEPETDGKS